MEGAPVLEVVDSPLDPEDAILTGQPLPEALPVLPLRDTVTFPETLTPLAVGQERSVQLVNDVLGTNRMLVMVASRDPENETPGPEDLYDVGVVGVVARMIKVPDGSLRILVQGTQRVRLGDYVAEQPYLVARISELPDVSKPSAELQALTRNVQRTFSEIVEQIPYLPEELQMAVANIDDPAAHGHLILGALRIETEEKQALLEEVDVVKRLRQLSRILARELEVVQLGTQIQTQVQSEIDKGQREFFLRQQLKAIQEELGEEDEQQAEANELRERIEAAGLPEHALKAAERELSRLEKLPPAAAEHGVIRTYLEWLVELPWSLKTEDNLDIKHAREVLDADHYDLEKVKDRILEYLAVRKLNPDSPGPILCFLGPPGVGKTSLGRSIAKALGREFERISVGGVRDEAEIRGHRRTYIGALPGKIIQNLKKVGTNNPVFLLDEVAKHAVDFWLSTEDLPMPDNRITLEHDGSIKLSYTPNNQVAKQKLYDKLKSMLNHLGMHPNHLIPRNLYMKNEIDVGGVAHQAGTARFGKDPKTSVLDVDCKAHELDNLYIVDTSFFPSIGAVNPALTAMANALRVGDHLLQRLK